MFDLEDSVEAGRKDDARRAVAEYLRTDAASASQRWVRINSSHSSWWSDDLAWLAEAGSFDAVVVPKAEASADIERASHAAGGRAVVPLLETSRGILQATAIATARATIPALLFGAEDLTAEIGVPRTVDGDELIVARSLVVLAASAAGADAIDAVFIDIAATDQLRRDAERARALGFRGKMAIHPSQIPVIHDVFTPSAEEIERARRIVEASDAAAAAGLGVIRLDDRMIDAPVVSRARKILSLASRLATPTRTPS